LVLENTDKFIVYKSLFDYLKTLLLVQNIGKDKTELSKVIEFNNEYKSHHLPLLLKITDAIIQKKVIQFEHFNHFRGQKAIHIVEPWFVKYYDNKYFLGCYRLQKENNTNDTGYKTFTINQIEPNSIKILEQNINTKRKSNRLLDIRHDIFEHCIGVRIHKENTPNEICQRADIYVETNYKIGKDWLNIPIHKNQKLIETKDNGNHVFMFPNFFFNDAFIKLILSNANQVKIIKPQSVANEFLEKVKFISKYY
jgi:predicted DNA-binding transcriptional regulator YafY